MRELLAAALDGDSAMDALDAARELRTLLYEWEGVLAREAVEGGSSWEEIGTLLGVSRQAAWNRYKGTVGETPAIREARERVERARNRLA